MPPDFATFVLVCLGLSITILPLNSRVSRLCDRIEKLERHAHRHVECDDC